MNEEIDIEELAPWLGNLHHIDGCWAASISTR